MHFGDALLDACEDGLRRPPQQGISQVGYYFGPWVDGLHHGLGLCEGLAHGQSAGQSRHPWSSPHDCAVKRISSCIVLRMACLTGVASHWHVRACSPGARSAHPLRTASREIVGEAFEISMEALGTRKGGPRP